MNHIVFAVKYKTINILNQSIMWYKLEFEDYHNKNYDYTKFFTTWEEAIKAYNEIPINPNWTRHMSCNEEINHMDMRYNLFNEVAIKLNPIDSTILKEEIDLMNNPIIIKKSKEYYNSLPAKDKLTLSEGLFNILLFIERKEYDDKYFGLCKINTILHKFTTREAVKDFFQYIEYIRKTEWNWWWKGHWWGYPKHEGINKKEDKTLWYDVRKNWIVLILNNFMIYQIKKTTVIHNNSS